ncbi:hypothetical protein Fmac_011656 [Flemingia macrophylla]|uniref:Uncharacterized protein n=1 Tax=Flemingia macrophylla TaxID=520843 RepID=A0ABD1MN23_9FABA
MKQASKKSDFNFGDSVRDTRNVATNHPAQPCYAQHLRSHGPELCIMDDCCNDLILKSQSCIIWKSSTNL